MSPRANPLLPTTRREKPVAEVKIFPEHLEVIFADGSVYEEPFHSAGEAFEILQALLEFEVEWPDPAGTPRGESFRFQKS